MRTDPLPSILWAQAFVVNIGSEDSTARNLLLSPEEQQIPRAMVPRS
jgi:hypothetical protein